MPPSPDATCRYTADWISVKLTWDLSVDPAERDALTRLADGCPDQDIVYTPAPAHTSQADITAQPRDQIQCPRGYVCIYPDINYGGQPYVKRASDGSVRHLPDYIRGHGSSIINNSGRTARVYQKDNYFGRHVCVGRDGGTIGDLHSYGMNDTTHSLKNNDTPCGA